MGNFHGGLLNKAFFLKKQKNAVLKPYHVVSQIEKFTKKTLIKIASFPVFLNLRGIKLTNFFLFRRKSR